MDVSIIIPTKNGADLFDECLSGVFSQDTSLQYEVIVIDSGSADETLEIARKFPVVIETIKPDEFGHGRTRNLGGKMATGEYLVYLTQDAVPADSNWLDSLIENFADPKVAGAYSMWIPRRDCNPLEKRRITEAFVPIKEVRSLEGVSEFEYKNNMKRFVHFSNVSSAIRKEVWEKIPFDDNAPFAEDQAWAADVLEAGNSIVYEPGSRVYHSHNDSLRVCFQRGYDGATFQARLKGSRFNPIQQVGVFLYLTLSDCRYLIKSGIGGLQMIKWFIYAMIQNSVRQTAVFMGAFSRHV